MSDIRQKLIRKMWILRATVSTEMLTGGPFAETVADAILADFDVTEKPTRYYVELDKRGNRCVWERGRNYAIVTVADDNAFSRALASEIAHFMNEKWGL